ncbi:MAG: PQQ-binding-like beta-propeller repeat protein [Planctomycetota bacterium]
MKRSIPCPLVLVLLAAALRPAVAPADTWPQKPGDAAKTGRAAFVVPASRMNNTFFNILRWQKRTPNSPNEGNLSSSGMAFFDGAGPGSADLLVAGYHWPKGVQGMDRHTGKRFWYGNPSGGESIGVNTPAFSNDGAVIYVTNDATTHPLMAFRSTVGPANFWHNGGDPEPGHMGAFSPVVALDGRIFLHGWNDRAYGATDLGNALTETWAASSGLCACLNQPSLYEAGGQTFVVHSGRCGQVKVYDGTTGWEFWSVDVGAGTDADATIDPANGNIYVPIGWDSIWIVGLDAAGQPLWNLDPRALVFDYFPGIDEPQHATGIGCLSHDGATYYFQTVGQQGNGRLYAINTANGTVKWEYQTGSGGWELTAACPIVTPNNVIVVGNNDGGVYYAIQDTGAAPLLLDALETDGTGRAPATLADDGLLYLPLRMTWLVGNGDGETPTFATENVYTCFDLNDGAAVELPPPAWQLAIALNEKVEISWKPIIDPTGQFHHYAVYRATAPFTNVTGMTPIGTVAGINSTQFVDTTAVNGIRYHYAVTSVSIGGGEGRAVQSTGPRTPRDETDLQVLTISRTPRYPRYLPRYTYYQVTEPSGFGPYIFSAATGLSGGQDPNTPRWPTVGQPVTYTATIRNRGTNPWSGTLSGTWKVDGQVVGTPSRAVSLQPRDTTTFTFVLNWDDQLHDVQFIVNVNDAQAANNTVTIGTKSAPFLTYVDLGFVEDFREKSTPNYPQAATGDMLDWLQRHAAEMNRMFIESGSLKRCHYDVLETTRDGDPDPNVDRTPFGIFPFRYYIQQWSDPRAPGYYHPDVDIDYGLCHELSHQLGLIDIYQLDIPPQANQVSNMGYTAVPCLMHGCSPFYSEHSARGMTKWAHIVHGYYGQYMYDIPATVQMRFLDYRGQPLVGATVRMYQNVERPGQGKVITSQIKAQGVTNAAGVWTLPNVPVNPAMVPAVPAGVLHDNPFGYLAVVGTNGVLHFKIEYDDFVDYAWLDITEVNVAYWRGQTAAATFTRQLSIGGGLQLYPPADMAELNVANWTAWAQDGTITLYDDTARKVVGQGSLRAEATGGFDNYIRYPHGLLAKWDLSNVESLHFRAYAINPNGGFQNQSPWIRLGSFQNGYFQWTPSWDILNSAIGMWREFTVPIAGNSTWTRTTVGTPSLSHINYFQLHADTWGAGFTLWLDGIGFSPQPHKRGDLDCNGLIDFNDINPFVQALSDPAAYAAAHPNCPFENRDCNADGLFDFNDIKPFVALLGG